MNNIPIINNDSNIENNKINTSDVISRLTAMKNGEDLPEFDHSKANDTTYCVEWGIKKGEWIADGIIDRYIGELKSITEIGTIHNTVICAAFCGAGKTYICEKTNIKAIEIEYWKYKEKGLFKEYIEDIKKHMGKVDYIFIATDPDGLKLLANEEFEIFLIYPKNELRNEYLDRYIERNSPYEFIGTFMKHWNIWIDELKKQKYCNHIVLEKGQYLQDVL